MTLNITLLTPAAIYQSADFRLTNATDGTIIRDESAKTVVLQYQTFSGFVTYTGIGAWGGVDLSAIIGSWLDSTSGSSMANIAAILETEGTRLLNEVRRRNRKRFGHTFTLAGFEDRVARVYIVSNFEDCFGRTIYPVSADLATTMREIKIGNSPVAIVTGQTNSISNAARRALCQLAIRKPDDGGLIRSHMQSLNSFASKSRESHGTVSPDCVVLSFRSDGLGLIQMSDNPGAGPKNIPVILDGFDQNKFLLESMAKISLDFSNARMQNATFATTQTLGPITEVPSTCRFPLVFPDASAGYDIEEITGLDFDTLAATDINDAAQVVGTGRLERTTPWKTSVPWVLQEGVVHSLGFQGAAVSISNDGPIAVNVRHPYDGAGLLSGEMLRVFDLVGPSIAQIDASRSTASATNTRGYVAGSVCTQSGLNMRAAVFHEAHLPFVLSEPIAKFGTRAVDINDEGKVLVLGSFGPSDVRAIIWDLEKDNWRYLGDAMDNVHPVSLNNDGTALGYVGDTALISDQDGSWVELGTANGWYPKDINELGDVVGIVWHDGSFQPWLRLSGGETYLLPFVGGHSTEAIAINNKRDIIGGAHSDHGGHALIWRHR
ncbi:hypothetical protein ACTJJE_05880 [Mycolicibacterium sp. 22603]|uniref:hypothetical protein n=1 Tax=Mycolicibacterium sp. 22603 TaxID=3453950 RepID=UPI003F8280EB